MQKTNKGDVDGDVEKKKRNRKEILESSLYSLEVSTTTARDVSKRKPRVVDINMKDRA